jgi:hypothetical protein
LNRIDPGVHRRIKGLRLVTAFGIAAMLGTMGDISKNLPGSASLSLLAANFALWASVSESRATRAESSRDLILFSIAAALGAASCAILLAPLMQLGKAAPELVLVLGAFCVGYLRRFGPTGTGIGSQIYIGQVLAYGAGVGFVDLPTIAVAALIAAVAAIVPRVLSGPAERPLPYAAIAPDGTSRFRPELAMGIQSAAGTVIIVLLNAAFGLLQSEWAITACVYVIASSSAGTIDRVKRRIVGTLVGVPIAIAFLHAGASMPILVWTTAAVAMIVYAMALPERYDIASGAYAFTLIVTLAVVGEQSIAVLAARAWETLLGGVIGIAAATIFSLSVRRGH